MASGAHNAADQEVDKGILNARQRDWDSFTKFTTYSVVAICLLLVGMAVFLL